MTNIHTSTFRFRQFEFDKQTGELRGEGVTVRLAPKPALVLSLLLENAGTLVTRETLQDRIWPNTIVEFDKGLNFLVRQVRSALGDEAANPTFVETLPRRGYRFIADVETLRHVGAQPSDARFRRRFLPRPIPLRRPIGVSLACVVAAAALIVATSTWWASDGRGTDPRARELAELGGYLLTQQNRAEVARSVSYFKRALAVDPGYARAYAGLGNAYLFLSRPDEGKAALRRSLELDPKLWASHVNLALRALYVDYDRTAAREHFQRALALAGDEVVVRHTVAWFRAVSGDLEGAVAQMRVALNLDPVSPRVNGDVGRLFYLAGRYDEAVLQCRRSRELFPDALSSEDCIVHSLVEAGSLEAAREEAVNVMRTRGAPARSIDRVASGEPLEALDAYWRWSAEVIEELAGNQEDSYVRAAAAWARAGVAERAFRDLEEAYRVRCPILPQIPWDPAFEPLRTDPAYLELLRRIDAPVETTRAPSTSGPDGVHHLQALTRPAP